MKLLPWYTRWWNWLLIKLRLRKPDPILWVANMGWKYTTVKLQNDYIVQLTETPSISVDATNIPQ